MSDTEGGHITPTEAHYGLYIALACVFIVTNLISHNTKDQTFEKCTKRFLDDKDYTIYLTRGDVVSFLAICLISVINLYINLYDQKHPADTDVVIYKDTTWLLPWLAYATIVYLTKLTKEQEKTGKYSIWSALWNFLLDFGLLSTLYIYDMCLRNVITLSWRYLLVAFMVTGFTILRAVSFLFNKKTSKKSTVLLSEPASEPKTIERYYISIGLIDVFMLCVFVIGYTWLLYFAYTKNSFKHPSLVHLAWTMPALYQGAYLVDHLSNLSKYDNKWTTAGNCFLVAAAVTASIMGPIGLNQSKSYVYNFVCFPIFIYLGFLIWGLTISTPQTLYTFTGCQPSTKDM